MFKGFIKSCLSDSTLQIANGFFVCRLQRHPVRTPQFRLPCYLKPLDKLSTPRNTNINIQRRIQLRTAKTMRHGISFTQRRIHECTISIRRVLTNPESIGKVGKHTRSLLKCYKRKRKNWLLKLVLVCAPFFHASVTFALFRFTFCEAVRRKTSRILF